jgi:hypothetical protein
MASFITPPTSAETTMDLLRRFKWLRPVDYVLIAANFLTWVVVGVVASYVGITASQALSITLLGQLHVIYLLFMAMKFILLLTADAQLLSISAASLAMRYTQGNAPDMPSDTTFFDRRWKEQYAVLKEAGWVGPMDYRLAIGIVVLCAAGYAQWAFGHASTPFMLAANCLVGTWALTLAYRCSYFVIQALSVIRGIPSEAARLVVLYQGQP